MSSHGSYSIIYLSHYTCLLMARINFIICVITCGFSCLILSFICLITRVSSRLILTFMYVLLHGVFYGSYYLLYLSHYMCLLMARIKLNICLIRHVLSWFVSTCISVIGCEGTSKGCYRIKCIC